MEIITFLVKHIYLLVILIAVVGPLISRFLKKELSGSPMPPFGGPQRPPSPTKAARTNHSGPVNSAAENTRQPMIVGVREEEASRPVVNRRVTSPSTSTAEESESIDRDDLIRGVIWSEILAPPRAKRPYRR